MLCECVEMRVFYINQKFPKRDFSDQLFTCTCIEKNHCCQFMHVDRQAVGTPTILKEVFPFEPFGYKGQTDLAFGWVRVKYHKKTSDLIKAKHVNASLFLPHADKKQRKLK